MQVENSQYVCTPAAQQPEPVGTGAGWEQGCRSNSRRAWPPSADFHGWAPKAGSRARIAASGKAPHDLRRHPSPGDGECGPVPGGAPQAAKQTSCPQETPRKRPSQTLETRRPSHSPASGLRGLRGEADHADAVVAHAHRIGGLGGRSKISGGRARGRRTLGLLLRRQQVLRRPSRKGSSTWPPPLKGWSGPRLQL